MPLNANLRPVLSAALMAACSVNASPTSVVAQPSKDRVQPAADYAPGITIDWNRRLVEVQGEVCLRDGMLELFACAPRTREHESVVMIRARPKKLYEALGLIGLQPGHPIRYDKRNERWLPPAGDALGIKVRWQDRRETRIADISTWMRGVDDNKPMTPTAWVFAGSQKTEAGKFAADLEGTVIAVVDFPSALIAFPGMHSADNALLTLEANTDNIPSVGTSVTLLFSPIDPVPFNISVDKDGVIRFDGKTMSHAALTRRLQRFQRDHAYTTVVIQADPKTSQEERRRVEKTVRASIKPGTQVRLTGQNNAAKVDHPRRER